jgi:hypothetical protein
VLEEMKESVEAGFEMVKVKSRCFLPRKLVKILVIAVVG